MHAYIVYFFQRAVQIVRGKRPRATTPNGDGKRGGGLLYFSANIMLCEGAVPWAVATKVGRSPIYIAHHYIWWTKNQMAMCAGLMLPEWKDWSRGLPDKRNWTRFSTCSGWEHENFCTCMLPKRFLSVQRGVDRSANYKCGPWHVILYHPFIWPGLWKVITGDSHQPNHPSAPLRFCFSWINVR